MGILEHHQRRHHQHLITTHAPAVIAAADPHKILLVSKEGAESVVEPINV